MSACVCAVLYEGSRYHILVYILHIRDKSVGECLRVSVGGSIASVEQPNESEKKQSD